MKEQEERVFSIVVDSRDEARTAGEILKTLRRLKEYKRINCVACDDRLEQMTRRLLEYEALHGDI